MKITDIEIANVFGARDVVLHLQRPVTILAGGNGNGKTSILQGVALALSGALARGITLKKDYAQLVHEGQAAGQVTVMADGREHYMVLPKGKGQHAAEHVALPYVLDATRLSSLSDKDRKTFLFNLLDIRITSDLVKARLKERGADMAKAERVVPMLRAGFEDAAKLAAEQATLSKGAWKTVTGEQWGSEKAIDWVAEVPEFSQPALDALLSSAADTDEALAQANQKVGALQAQINQQSSAAADRAALQEKAGKIDRIKTKMSVDEAETKSFEIQLETLLAASTRMKCPDCGVALFVQDNQLMHADGDTMATVDLQRIPALREALRINRTALANDQRDLAAAEAARDRLAAMEAAGAHVKESELLAAKGEVTSLQAARADLTKQIDAMTAVKRAATDAGQKTTKAADHHKDIMAWLAIAEALGPNGIPGDLLKEALAPVNARLAQSAEDTSWLRVVINADMSITFGGRLHQLLSKSEKWRADAMLTEMVSHLSGLRMFMVDEFDILDLQGRAQALAWLDTLGINSEVDTVLVGATLKSATSAWLESVEAFWVHGGVCRCEALAEAA
ncbi:MAG: AAA family ATPase [Aquabacterium sp.]